MNKSKNYSALALVGGGLLALMIHQNSLLGAATSALSSSWLAHGLGGITALIVYSVLPRTRQSSERNQEKQPLWFYLGGLPGAFTVVLASITVNSALGLAGTLALGLIGQLVFSMLCEKYGVFGLVKRRFSHAELFSIAAITFGSVLIISQRV